MARERSYIIIEGGHCIVCGRCVETCPERCLSMISVDQLDFYGIPELEEARCWEEGVALVLDDRSCLRCGLCRLRCPAKAIHFGRGQ